MMVIYLLCLIMDYPAYDSLEVLEPEAILVGVKCSVPKSTGGQSKVCRTKNGRSQSAPVSQSPRAQIRRFPALFSGHSMEMAAYGYNWAPLIGSFSLVVQ
jgi:hypothetical protein